MMPETGRCFVHFKALTMKTHTARGVAHDVRTDDSSTKNPHEPQILNRGALYVPGDDPIEVPLPRVGREPPPR